MLDILMLRISSWVQQQTKRLDFRNVGRSPHGTKLLAASVKLHETLLRLSVGEEEKAIAHAVKAATRSIRKLAKEVDAVPVVWRVDIYVEARMQQGPPGIVTTRMETPTSKSAAAAVAGCGSKS